jgi:hypothetical protein
MIIRHGEKPSDPDDHGLNATGRRRAQALAELFTRPTLPAGLSRPTALYASRGDTASLRPLQTLAPLSERLGLRFDATDTEQIAAELRRRGGASLVCWAHTELPDNAAALGPVTPRPPRQWPDDRFDMVWVLPSDGNGGWRFAQVPELVLPGDRPSLIT